MTTGLPRQRFRSRLAARPLLVDGGMGTLLFSRGVPQRACLEELVGQAPGARRRRPSRVPGGRRRADRDAVVRGQPAAADGLGPGGPGRRGSTGGRPSSPATPARSAGATRSSAGRSGPLGSPTRGWPVLARGRRAGASSASRSTVCSRVASTSSSSRRSRTSSSCCWPSTRRDAPSDLPIIASLTFGEELVLADGTQPGGGRRGAGRAGADAVGVNCGAGPVACLDALEAMGTPARGRPGALDHAERRACRSGSRGASSTPPAPSTSGR